MVNPGWDVDIWPSLHFLGMGNFFLEISKRVWLNVIYLDSFSFLVLAHSHEGRIPRGHLLSRHLIFCGGIEHFASFWRVFEFIEYAYIFGWRLWRVWLTKDFHTFPKRFDWVFQRAVCGDLKKELMESFLLFGHLTEGIQITQQSVELRHFDFVYVLDNKVVNFI